MKLYATVSSERARKGQGGNECLNIIVRNKEQQAIAHINFYPDNTCRISILDTIDVDYDKPHWIGTNDDSKDISIGFPKTKVKKEKGECIFGHDHAEHTKDCIIHN